MLTVDLLANTALSVPSALIIRLFFASCSLFFLMYAHSRLVTSVRGIGLEPTTSASAADGVTGAMKAAFARRGAFFAVLAFLAVRFFAVLAIWPPLEAAFGDNNNTARPFARGDSCCVARNAYRRTRRRRSPDTS